MPKDYEVENKKLVDKLTETELAAVARGLNMIAAYKVTTNTVLTTLNDISYIYGGTGLVPVMRFMFDNKKQLARLILKDILGE